MGTGSKEDINMTQTAIAKTNELKTLVQSTYVQERFKDVLGKKSQGFIASMLSIVSNNELLATADHKSILNAAMTAATLDLPINQNLGFAYIIPYNDRKTGKVLAQFQMGYKGFIQLAQRSGQFVTLNVTDVREGEIIDNNLLTGEITYKWITKEREKAEVVGYVAYIKLVNGFEKSLFMTIKELKDHGLRYSKGYKMYNSGLWVDDFDAMASKTVIKLLLSKYAPLTTQMQTAQLADQAIIKGEGDYEHVDNKPLLPAEVANDKERERIVKHIAEAKTVDDLEQCEEYIVDDETRELFNSKKDKLSKPKKVVPPVVSKEEVQQFDKQEKAKA